MAKNTEKNSEIAARFSEIRELFFKNDNTLFADKLGVRTNTASSYCTGSAPIGIEPVLQLLEAVPDLNARWLLTGEGKPTMAETCQMVIGDNNTATQTTAHPTMLDTIAKQAETIRILAAKIAAHEA